MSYYTDPALVKYIERLEAYPDLTREQEVEADPDKLVLHTLRYVIRIAKQYAYRTEDLADFIQEGNIGLINATTTYDPEKGSFISWATGYIKGKIRAAQVFNKSVVKIPRDAYTYYHTIHRMVKTHTKEEIAKELGIKLYIIDIALRTDSMVELDINIPAADDSIIHEKDSLLRAVDRYPTEKQKQVLILRLKGLTHQAIADKMGVSYQNIQQLEKSAIKSITKGAA